MSLRHLIKGSQYLFPSTCNGSQVSHVHVVWQNSLFNWSNISRCLSNHPMNLQLLILPSTAIVFLLDWWLIDWLTEVALILYHMKSVQIFHQAGHFQFSLNLKFFKMPQTVTIIKSSNSQEVVVILMVGREKTYLGKPFGGMIVKGFIF